MWIVNYEDGSSIGSKDCYWTGLPTDKKITGLQLLSPKDPKFYISLKNYDRYYFAQEAVAMRGQSHGTPTAEIIGGHDLDLGVGTEIRFENKQSGSEKKGAIQVRTYPLAGFRFAQENLREGRKKGRPRVETPDEVRELSPAGEMTPEAK